MPTARSRLPPIVPALLLQALAIALTLLALRIAGVALPPWSVALLPAARCGPALRVIDLGSGLGGLLLFLAAARRDVEFQGVELAPLPMLISRLRVGARRLHNCTIRWGSYWRRDLRDYDVVFAFLSPVPMSELWLKARREMRAGSLFISSSFEVPGQQATRIITVDDARGTRLHVWRMAP